MNQVIGLSTGKGPDIMAEGVDISESGMLCRTDVEIKTGSRVTFKMTIPGSKTPIVVDCEGNVIKCEKKDGKFNVVVDFTEDALM